MKRITFLWILLMLNVTIAGVEAANKSHLTQKIKNHVMLVSDFVDPEQSLCGLSFEGKALYEVFPDGTISETPFQVEHGELIITDVEWSVLRLVTGGALSAGRTLRLDIRLGPSGPSVFQSSMTLDANSATGRPGKSEYATTGIVVGSGVVICPIAVQVSDFGVALARIESVILRGYLMP